jgi:hypothetical protein
MGRYASDVVEPFTFGALFQDPGFEQMCPSCGTLLTLLTGSGWSRCPFDGSHLQPVDLLRALAPTAKRSRGSRHLSRWVHGRLPRVYG